MKMKLALFACAAACALMLATPALADTTDHQSFCTGVQARWQTVSTQTSVVAVRSFREGVSERMCPTTARAADARIQELETRDAENAARLEVLRQQAATNSAAAEMLRQANAAAARERTLRQRAEAEAAVERAAREAREAAERVPGRERRLLACLVSQDIARFDRGNIQGTQIDRLEVAPEIQVVYDLADAAQGVIDVYGWDLDQRQWSRGRIAAELNGNILTVGSTSENEQNARIRGRTVIDLDAMTANGQGLFEPINAGGQSAIDITGGQANLNVGALFQRPPRVWLETRGNCAFQSGSPPGPLTSTPTWRITDRAIPTIPPMPRR